MSWQSYVDSNLLGTGKVKRAAILGLAGGVWATSTGYTISPEEQKAIVPAFKDPAGIRAHGIILGGKKFFTLQATDRSIYGKQGANGCVLVKTTQAVLVAEYEAPFQQPEAAVIVEALADYLISVSY